MATASASVSTFCRAANIPAMGAAMNLGTLAYQNGTFADAATITGTQTLTNKTLTAPVINVASDAIGDIYFRNAGGLFARLPIGASTNVLTVNGGVPTWQASSGGSAYLAGTGLTLTGSTFAINSLVVTTSGTQTLTNKTLTSPIINVFVNDPGDIYYRNGSNQFTRLPIGSTAQVLTVAAGFPIWAAAPSASGGGGGGGGTSWSRPVVYTSSSVLPPSTQTALMDNSLEGVLLNLPVVNDGIGPITVILINATNTGSISVDDFSSDSIQTNSGLESFITLTHVGDFATFEPGPTGSATWYLKVDGRRSVTLTPPTISNQYKILTNNGTITYWTDTADYLKVSGLGTDVLITNTAGFLQNYHTTVYGDSTSGSFRMSLPDATTLDGKIYTFIKKDSSANYVGMDGDGSQTIGGALVYDLTLQDETVTIQSIEGNWKIINSNKGVFGYINITSSRTLTNADNGKVLKNTTGINYTLTVPAGLALPFTCGLKALGAGKLVIAVSGGNVLKNVDTHTSVVPSGGFASLDWEAGTDVWLYGRTEA